MILGTLAIPPLGEIQDLIGSRLKVGMCACAQGNDIGQIAAARGSLFAPPIFLYVSCPPPPHDVSLNVPAIAFYPKPVIRIHQHPRSALEPASFKLRQQFAHDAGIHHAVDPAPHIHEVDVMWSRCGKSGLGGAAAGQYVQSCRVERPPRIEQAAKLRVFKHRFVKQAIICIWFLRRL